MLNDRNLDSAQAKLDIICGMAGSDPEVALCVLSYALMHVAHANNVMFASVVENLAKLEIMILTGDHND